MDHVRWTLVNELVPHTRRTPQCLSALSPNGSFSDMPLFLETSLTDDAYKRHCEWGRFHCTCVSFSIEKGMNIWCQYPLLLYSEANIHRFPWTIFACLQPTPSGDKKRTGVVSYCAQVNSRLVEHLPSGHSRWNHTTSDQPAPPPAKKTSNFSNHSQRKSDNNDRRRFSY
jgi:hypothetical protein